MNKHFPLGELVWQRQDSPANRLGSGMDGAAEDANWAGNIFFANGGEWASHIRDLYCYRLPPERFKSYGGAGAWVCLECSIEHLAKALPDDVIRADMRVHAIFSCGVELSFDYLALERGQPVRQLARGRQKMAWVGKDARDEPILRHLSLTDIEALTKN